MPYRSRRPGFLPWIPIIYAVLALIGGALASIPKSPVISVILIATVPIVTATIAFMVCDYIKYRWNISLAPTSSDPIHGPIVLAFIGLAMVAFGYVSQIYSTRSPRFVICFILFAIGIFLAIWLYRIIRNQLTRII